MKKTIAAVGLLATLLTACAALTDTDDNTARASGLARSSFIVDTHIDVPYRLQREPADVSVALASGDFDYPRAVDGGLNAAFMSIYTPADLEETGESFAVAESLIDRVEALAAEIRAATPGP